MGTTEDETVSRMTIRLRSNDATFEQIKKQLNRCVEVIKVIDFTDNPIHMKELLFVKIRKCSKSDMEDLFRIAEVFHVSIIDCDRESVLLECVQTENKNNGMINLLCSKFKNIEVVRGGSVAIESISMTER